MKEDIFRLSSISQLTQLFDFPKPTHPLIYIVDVATWKIGKAFVGMKYLSELYTIGLKDKSCGLQYGRNHYDFDEGVLFFTGPNQVASTDKEQQLNEIKGWMLFFHPDLIRTTPLGKSIDEHHYFSYAIHEALHLSDKEQKTITDCIDNIQEEISERIDVHSNKVIVASLELLLQYCQRFYERQFHTRTAQNKDIVTRMNEELKAYYENDLFSELGLPSIQFFADKIHLSPNYLSDLLKKESGVGAKEYIHEFLIDKAKTLLLGTHSSVSEISYKLGFNYPHYFGRLFRVKTGMTPKAYRQINS
jgi:AraC-like DNA-binding protein